ncbi:PREDICTED: endosomal/lysomomal potassium channel TMEM175-like [Branchiostoma belcheri]|uniref:Endosomal/lysosomal proton channel TMEM175 n=1 Tax=Branchiostoma belcheri TaxID=7741 RepID=A0A6P4ZWB7_BRABE|nr:PREDICTED: endosomal/lysomomal potassium channel TMEM175-like [Branchiostoma belcheri]
MARDQHISSSERLLSYSDAVFSIITTIMFLMFAEHPREPLAVVLFCSSITIAGALMAGIAWQAYTRPNLLEEDEARYGEIKSKRCRTMLMVLGKPIIAVVAGGVAWIAIEAAWALLVMLLLEPLLRQVIISIYYFAKGNGEAGSKVFSPSRLVVERSDPLRTKVYSDGVYAIIATLIILDICVENVPSKDEDIAKHGDLISALKHDQHVFMSYAGTFITICMLWYLHHSIFYALMFAGLLPIVFKITGEFGKDVSAGDAALAVQLNACTVLLSSIWHLVMWIVIMKNQSKLLHRFVDVDKDKYMNTFMLTRLCVYPIISVLLFFLCFVPSWQFDSEVINWVQISTPAVFIIIKIIRNCVQRVEDRKRSSDEETPERSHLAAKENNIDHGNEITAV